MNSLDNLDAFCSTARSQVVWKQFPRDYYLWNNFQDRKFKKPLYFMLLPLSHWRKERWGKDPQIHFYNDYFDILLINTAQVYVNRQQEQQISVHAKCFVALPGSVLPIWSCLTIFFKRQLKVMVVMLCSKTNISKWSALHACSQCWEQLHSSDGHLLWLSCGDFFIIIYYYYFFPQVLQVESCVHTLQSSLATHCLDVMDFNIPVFCSSFVLNEK